ncbi:MAG: hypothetical protein PHW10_05720 [Candidatus Peribacteraceae bacterium]|nr:hypothetical protein [Candidatus Peribacteraceae bacterium]
MLRDLLSTGSPMEIFATFVALALVVASLLCLVFIILGGINFILSAGNEEKIKKAMHTIRYAIIGLFISFIAYFAVSWIARILDIPFQLDFSTIAALMQDIFSSLSQ